MTSHYGILPQTKESMMHILRHYEAFKEDRERQGLPRQPMMVGLSGCQGSGKTTLCDTLTHLLRESPYRLNVVNFSLDDFYLRHQDQLKLSQTYPDNPLYQQRGQAGSHDIPLAIQTIQHVLRAQEGEKVPIPVYDKSCFGGKGDRLAETDWKYPTGPFDIVLFEGWMLGFKPLPTSLISNTHHQRLNQLLIPYHLQMYPYFDIFIHLSPQQLNQVYQWRLQQEHSLKLTKGQGLSDEAVRLFVDSYMPAYQLYLPRLDQVGFYGYGLHGEPHAAYEGLFRRDHGYSQPNRHLRIVLDSDRRVLDSQTIREPNQTQQVGWLTTKRMCRIALVGLLGFVGYRGRRWVIHQFFKFSNRWSLQ
ncbi:P-loop containing nucleoside triphosphate hydrolase protein [Choanephora cucurbitarum]|nr:P-loop containing nucleoside triphosphate hydrolase protein [Choanephora cucurbitarum]